jgi:NADH-quinone oxidoreductase subunit I
MTDLEPRMPIPDKDIVNVDAKPLSRAQQMYLPEVFKGLGTTIRNMMGTIGNGKLSKTMQYPEERRENIPVEEGGMHKANFRGVHRLNRDEQCHRLPS